MYSFVEFFNSIELFRYIVFHFHLTIGWVPGDGFILLPAVASTLNYYVIFGGLLVYAIFNVFYGIMRRVS